jgi:hypothetical protein
MNQDQNSQEAESMDIDDDNSDSEGPQDLDEVKGQLRFEA